MNFLKNIKKIRCLEILLITLIICFIVIFYHNSKKKEGFVEIRDGFTRKTNNDAYDDFYANIYDDLVYNKAKNRYHVGRILDNFGPTDTQVILNVGCATGHLANLLNTGDNSVLGIDKSEAMVKKSQENYPEMKFQVCDGLTAMDFYPNTFTTITCLDMNIYHIKNKKQFLENCFEWLVPGGILLLHLVDMKKSDSIHPIGSDFAAIQSKGNTKERVTENELQFDTLDYKSIFNLDLLTDSNSVRLDAPNATFKEVIKFKDPKRIRINEYGLYMSSQYSILGLVRDIGFSLKSQEEMSGINYKYNYLYTLHKPN